MSVHSEAAQTLVGDLRALRQKIPNLTVPISKGERKKLASAAAVPAEFVERTTVATENNRKLTRGDALLPEQARELMSYAEAFEPVAEEVEALARFLRHSVTAARNKAGSDALVTYALAQKLAQNPEHADLAPWLADMRRSLGPKAATGRKAKDNTEPEQPTTPAPVPTTPTPQKPS